MAGEDIHTIPLTINEVQQWMLWSPLAFYLGSFVLLALYICIWKNPKNRKKFIIDFAVFTSRQCLVYALVQPNQNQPGLLDQRSAQQPDSNVQQPVQNTANLHVQELNVQQPSRNMTNLNVQGSSQEDQQRLIDEDQNDQRSVMVLGNILVSVAKLKQKKEDLRFKFALYYIFTLPSQLAILIVIILKLLFVEVHTLVSCLAYNSIRLSSDIIYYSCELRNDAGSEDIDEYCNSTANETTVEKIVCTQYFINQDAIVKIITNVFVWHQIVASSVVLVVFIFRFLFKHIVTRKTYCCCCCEKDCVTGGCCNEKNRVKMYFSVPVFIVTVIVVLLIFAGVVIGIFVDENQHVWLNIILFLILTFPFFWIVYAAYLAAKLSSIDSVYAVVGTVEPPHKKTARTNSTEEQGYVLRYESV